MIEPYPRCDNCNRYIKTTGKTVVKNGLLILVHLTYNNKTEECE